MHFGNDLLVNTEKGLYCPLGDFYLDPNAPVKTAVISHAHSDHACPGSRRYFCASTGEALLRARIGEESRVVGHGYAEEFEIGGVTVSFHPAGHVLGSSQVRISDGRSVWVYSGDYKLNEDRTCEPFSPVECDVFITEATFGLPIYRWPGADTLFREINDWWQKNHTAGKTSVLFAYSLGKAQRVLSGANESIGPIFTHGAVERLTEVYRESGIDLPETTYVGDVEDNKEFAGALVIAPPSASASAWMKRFKPVSTAFASGWMTVRGARRRRALDRGFVMSDHADWNGLISAISQSRARRILVMHGFVHPLVRYLNEEGLDASAIEDGLNFREVAG